MLATIVPAKSEPHISVFPLKVNHTVRQRHRVHKRPELAIPNPLSHSNAKRLFFLITPHQMRMAFRFSIFLRHPVPQPDQEPKATPAAEVRDLERI